MATEQHDVIELGVASVETQGDGTAQVEIGGLQPRMGLSDD
ncbi:benenodin family lasso peptide [Sphingomonas sp. PP-CE-1G-424]|jgi:hypothetical protein|nr:benenodin family lasso peptide [Sphingomonas sp. PP-CE-1G-424]TCP65469.1 hypothetical protein C8J43_11119 [Sphingomonas sp. PP-CE-1G-424]